MLNETLHPEAKELTNLLFLLGDKPEELRAYEVLENATEHLCDDARADLYARIAESKIGEIGRVRAVSVVSKCLWQNVRAYPRG